MSDWMAWPYMVPAGIAVLALVFGVGKWVGGVNSDRGSFNAFMKGVQDDLGSIRASIEKILHRLPPVTVAHSSPIALTDLGRKVSRELDAPGWARRTAPKLVAGIEGQDRYAIQETCFEYVGGKLDADMEARVRSCAYENGLDREQVVRVLAVELRDRLLDVPPE